MPHIDVAPELPGIVALLRFRPETAAPLCELTEVLLRSHNSLTRAERELIGTFVADRNGCRFCTASHAAFAAAQLPEGMDLVDRVRTDPDGAPISAKLKALLRIADAVRDDGKAVEPELVAEARRHGATDVEIHDTVLIAAAFCMFNRYVDGLAATTPEDPEAYARVARTVVADGYRAVLRGEPVTEEVTEQVRSPA